jgi:chromosome segregation protein
MEHALKLKKLKIHGFKTFADKTELEINADLIAVVGPNGCGKSNIVDAIVWGLGEPNARQLRATNSQEIIFNGSSGRKPQAFAEVSLYFDNEDGALKVNTPEVIITRRVHRNGDSEYEINKQRCRLRDIFDLLADSGLGRSGYSIVGQKEIDAALAASAEDRRAWIDEAAGVQRYRAKRQESLRKLAQSDDHLSRVEDIVREIQSQREPLRQEAEIAQRYKVAVQELRSIEVGLMMREVSDAVRTIGQEDERIQSGRLKAAQEEEIAKRLELQAVELGDVIADLEREIDAVRELQQASLAARDRAEADIALVNQQLASFDELEQNLVEAKDAGQGRQEELIADVATAREEAQTAEDLDRKLGEELAGADAFTQALASRLQSLEGRLAKARELADALVRYEAEEKMRRARLKAVKAEVEGIEETLPELDQGITDAEAEVARLRKEISALDQKRKAFEGQATEKRKAEDALAHQIRDLLGQVARLDGKRRGIEATLEAHEGLSQGSRAVMAAAAEGILPKEYKPVGEAVSVDTEYAVAIDIALGASANDLIVPSESYAKEAIEWLKSNRLGRATFQPVSLMRPVAPAQDLLAVSRERGIVGRASELVECPSPFRPVIESLLGRVLIAETLDDALRLAKTRGWSRLVTLDGEVLHSSGAVTGGQSSRQGSGLVQRKSELDAVVLELETLQGNLHRLEVQKEKLAKHSVDPLTTEEQARYDELREELRDADQWLSGLRAERVQTAKGTEKLNQELTLLQAALERPEEPEDTTAIAEQRDAALQEIASRSADSAAALDRRTDAQRNLEAARKRLADAERRLENEVGGDGHRTRRLQAIEQDRVKARESIARHTEARSAAEKSYTENGQRLQSIQEAKRARLEESFACTEQSKSARANAQSLADLVHRAEVERARADARRASALERLLEEYGLDQDDALAQAGSIEVPDDAPARVNALRREIKAMGEVNLGAIDAFQRLTERHDELQAQVDDVLRGKEELESTIRELDKITKDKFQTTFERVRDEFMVSFNKLFGGGEGKLMLTDPQNLLDSGVDVEVTIPGKKRQRLELLSGGERALAASAFLFALLKVKPSPLVVLDEVDAPLDGRNVERYNAALRELAGTTQFICITHNPLTIEQAPMWFGVTMQEPGVSTVVPFRSGASEPVVAAAYMKG